MEVHEYMLNILHGYSLQENWQRDGIPISQKTIRSFHAIKATGEVLSKENVQQISEVTSELLAGHVPERPSLAPLITFFDILFEHGLKSLHLPHCGWQRGPL